MFTSRTYSKTKSIHFENFQIISKASHAAIVDQCMDVIIGKVVKW